VNRTRPDSAVSGTKTRNERTSAWSEAAKAARANLVPGLALQAFALALVLAYYLHAPTREALDAVAGLKQRTGYLYSLVSTALFGGFIPFVWLRLNAATRAVTPPSHGLFLLSFWAFKGVEVDLLYRAQGWLFGHGTDVGTVTAKVLVDQFVYVPLYSIPIGVLVYQWKESGFSWAAMRRLPLAGFLLENLPKALLATWIVWIPAVALIYSLPASLQIPLFNIVLCFYCLLFATLTRKAAG
jgi:hypothetical protein